MNKKFTHIHNYRRASNSKTGEENLKIGDQFREARNRMGLTQKATAQQLGVSASFINKIENGETLPSYDRLKEFCMFFALPLEEFWTALEAERTVALRSRIDARSVLLHRSIHSDFDQTITPSKVDKVSFSSKGKNVASSIPEKSSVSRTPDRGLAPSQATSTSSCDSTGTQEVRASCESLIAALGGKPEMAKFVKEAVESIANMVRSQPAT